MMAGFNDSVAKGPNKKILYSHNFRNLIPGDVAVAVEKALQEMGLEYEEATTLQFSMNSEIPREVPFVRYQADGGVEIPIGTYRIKDVGDITSHLTGSELPILQLTGTLISNAKRATWHEIVKHVGALSKTNSIFRGKAVRVEDPGDLLVPVKLDLENEVELVFNPDVEATITTCVLWPLLNRNTCLEKGIRTKRGAILEGHYGTGKSLLLYKAAQAAYRSGWGVLYLNPGLIKAALAIAPMLEPVCIIVEDADSGAHGSRDRLNGVLNTLSSAATKARGDYVLLLSTNFIDRIDPALLRPERIDAVINVPLPNRDTIKRLIALFANGKLRAGADLESTAEVLEGCTPAIISEIIQRSLIDGIREGHGEVTSASITYHAGNMDKQKRLALPELRQDSKGDQLAQRFYEVTQGEFQ